MEWISRVYQRVSLSICTAIYLGIKRSDIPWNLRLAVIHEVRLEYCAQYSPNANF